MAFRMNIFGFIKRFGPDDLVIFERFSEKK